MPGDAEKTIAQDYTPQMTRLLLAAACREAGLDPEGAELVRHQTNAVYVLATAPVVVKIARPDYANEHIQRIVHLVRWFMELGFPTVPLLDAEQPIIVDGAAATFWRYLPQERPIKAGDIGGPLRELHALPTPPVELPPLDAIAAIRYSLSRQRILDSDEHSFLTERCDTLEAQLACVPYEQPPRLIHGDPQHNNTLWDHSKPVLIDWDSVAIGHAEWDLITVEVHCRRFGHPASTYTDFCRTYGRDIRDWSGYQVLREVRELRMIATNARKSEPESAGAPEVHRRIGQLKQGVGGHWAIL